MKLLILGGTQFVGRHMTQAALDGGHEVTLFNRGQTNADLFPEVEKLAGNRDGDLGALKGREWDAVIDVNGYVPRLVRVSAELLNGTVGHYVFISTISVFADFSQPGINEDSPLAKRRKSWAARDGVSTSRMNRRSNSDRPVLAA